MDKTIHFENGSKIEILQAKESKRSNRGEEQMKQIITRYRKSPYELAKYTMGDTWNNLHWYQKLYYRIYCDRFGKARKTEKTREKRRLKCIKFIIVEIIIELM